LRRAAASQGDFAAIAWTATRPWRRNSVGSLPDSLWPPPDSPGFKGRVDLDG
jgi:hypothetical protein